MIAVLWAELSGLGRVALHISLSEIGALRTDQTHVATSSRRRSGSVLILEQDGVKVLAGA